jgi:hypothetical protein
VRGKIEMVLDSAKQWKGHLALILPGRDRGGSDHHAAMAYSDLPDFIRTLRTQESMAALALEFTILTACRSGEVRFAVWPRSWREGVDDSGKPDEGQA